MKEKIIVQCTARSVLENPACAGLLAEYQEECANRDLGLSDPQLPQYELLESTGSAQCFAAYVDAQLEGFAFVLMSRMTHFGKVGAVVESLFVRQSMRRSMLGLSLMRSVEAWAREHGCAMIFYSAPLGGSLQRLLQRSREYGHHADVFSRKLA